MLILRFKEPIAMLDTIFFPCFLGVLVGFSVVCFGFCFCFFIWQVCLNIQYFIAAFVFKNLVYPVCNVLYICIRT